MHAAMLEGTPPPTGVGTPPAPVRPEERFRGVELAIVLPTLNEEAGLEATFPELPLEALRKNGWRVMPLLIDGGSTDRTLEVARGYAIPVLHQHSRGKGAAIQEALSWLESQGVAYAVVLDADCTYPGASILPMVALLKAGSDVVVGVRYPAGTKEGRVRDLVHRGGNAFLNLSASVLSRRPILDLCSGLWGVRVKAASRLRLESTRFEVEAELFIKASRSGLIFHQIPILYRSRVGEAKLRAVRDGVQIFLTLFRWAGLSGWAPRSGGETGPRFLRHLLAICFVHGATRLTIRAPPSRAAESATLTRELQRAGVEVESVVASEQPWNEGFDPTRGGEAMRPGAVELEVHLPAVAPGTRDGSVAVAIVPHRGRIVVLGAVPPEGTPWVAALLRRGYRRDSEYGLPKLLTPLQAAHASVTGRRPRQETALLRANAFRSQILIFQRIAIAGAPPRPVEVPSRMASRAAEQDLSP